jgi:hypothetical protein
MSGLERLVTGEATDFERRLLGAWQQRQPSVEARVRARALAGVGLGAAVMTSAGATALKAATTSIGPKAVGGASVVVAKWIAVGLLGAVGTAGAVAYAHHIDAAEAKTNESPSPPAAPRAHSDQVTTTATVDLAPTTTQAVPRTPVSSSGKSKKLGSEAQRKSSTLDDEVSMIDQARRSVASGSASSALQILNAYDDKYPGGALAQESAEIRIESLIAQGDHSAAERLAAQFFASSPSSPYVHRLRKLLGEHDSP